MNLQTLALTLSSLKTAYRDGLTPRELWKEIKRRVASWNDPALFITFADDEVLEPWFQRLDGVRPDELPLYGVPFAVKDNIDCAGFPTTAACREFSYRPAESAFVVQLLIEAGALPIGKTNLDQFATGLVGARSPYGVPRNARGKAWIPGGSSSGSASAVAAGLAVFSLGTDTAGSGRVPACFQGLVGYKPTLGLVSTRGVVPACRSLDCVSVFAVSSDDARFVGQLAAKADPLEAYSHKRSRSRTSLPSAPILGVPRADQLEFFGDEAYREQFRSTVQKWKSLGAEVKEIDFTPFRRTAELLYQGPWVAERLSAVKDLWTSNQDAFHPVTRKVLSTGEAWNAVKTFDALHALEELRLESSKVWREVDALLTPTAGTLPTLEALEADPVGMNTKLGYYTNFMNLLDLSALALPAGVCPDGRPFGFTLVAPAGGDEALFAWGAFWETGTVPQKLGSTVVAVAGAHMKGLPLNGQLLERGARFLREDKTLAAYKLYTFQDGKISKPGLVRVEEAGVAFPLELWDLPEEGWGSFTALIPHPLGLGKIELADGTWVTGFLMEASHAAHSQDITASGGWRAWLASRQK